jgi:hypothetical protein
MLSGSPGESPWTWAQRMPASLVFGVPVLELLSSEDEALLVRRDAGLAQISWRVFNE